MIRNWACIDSMMLTTVTGFNNIISLTAVN